MSTRRTTKTRWHIREGVCCHWYLKPPSLRMVHERGCPNSGTENCEPVHFIKKRGGWNTCDEPICEIKRPHTHGMVF